MAFAKTWLHLSSPNVAMCSVRPHALSATRYTQTDNLGPVPTLNPCDRVERTLMGPTGNAYLPRRLKRVSQAWAEALVLTGCSLLVPGCLIAPPDGLEEQQQVMPHIYVHLSDPSPFSYVQTSSDGPQPVFRASFSSEDLEEAVVGKLYLNLDHEEQRVIGSAEVGHGTLEGGPREMLIPWELDRNRAAGCYVITMTIAVESNYSNEAIPLPDRSAADSVSWWVVHDMAPEDLTFDQCPQPQPELSQQPVP
jgi:hypothetical protein